MKKNGFIATSILYSFFLIFLTLFVALIANYINNRILLDRLDEDAREKLTTINNVQFSDLEFGDYVTFNHYEYKDGSKVIYKDPILKESANWVLFYKDNDSDTNYNKYYFLSTSTANNVQINIATEYETAPQNHAMNLDLYEYMKATIAQQSTNEYLYNYIASKYPSNTNYIQKFNKSYYQMAIGFDDDINHNNPYYVTDMRIPTVDDLSLIKGTTYSSKKSTSENYSDDVKEAVMNFGGDYVISDGTDYYLLRTYNFTSTSDNVDAMLADYCDISFDANSDAVTYNNSERTLFSFANKVRKTENSNSYVNYCYYSSKSAYDHTGSKEYDKYVLKSDTIGDYVKGSTGDKIILKSEQKSIRLMLEISVLKTKDTKNDDDAVYIDSGRGLANDPYRFVKGVKR